MTPSDRVTGWWRFLFLVLVAVDFLWWVLWNMTGDVKGVDLEQVSVTSGPSTVNVYNNDDKRHHRSSATLEHRVERLERATFGDDVIGLYGVIRQQQQQTRWLQILTVAVAVSEVLRLFLG